MVKDLPLTVYVVSFDAGHEIVLSLVAGAATGEAARSSKMFDGRPRPPPPKSLACTFLC